MRGRGMLIGAAMLAASLSVASHGVSAGSTTTDWIFASMTVPGAGLAGHPIGTSGGGGGAVSIGGPSSGASLKITMDAHRTGTGPALIGFGTSFGRGTETVRVFNTGDGDVALRTTDDLGALEIVVQPAGTGKFGGGSIIAGTGTRFIAAVFVTNAVIDSFSVNGTGGTPVVHAGSGSKAITAAGPGKGGIGVDASIAALGVTTYQATTPAGLIGGVNQLGCTRCSVTWSSPDGKTGTVDETAFPFVPLPIPLPAGTLDGEPTFAGPAGNWEWSWTGVNIQTTPGQTTIGAYAPIGDLWKEFTATSEPRAATPAAKPNPKPPAHVRGTKETRRSLAATGVGSSWFAAVGLLTGAACMRRRVLKFR